MRFESHPSSSASTTVRRRRCWSVRPHLRQALPQQNFRKLCCHSRSHPCRHPPYTLLPASSFVVQPAANILYLPSTFCKSVRQIAFLKRRKRSELRSSCQHLPSSPSEQSETLFARTFARVFVIGKVRVDDSYAQDATVCVCSIFSQASYRYWRGRGRNIFN